MAAQGFDTSQAERGPSKAPRNQAIEALRIIAAYGIVAFHSGARFHDVAYSGLVVFLILSPMADVRFNLHRVRSVGHLARILMIPWLFWWVVYGIRNIAIHKVFLATPYPLVGVLYGTSPHLWFMPYIFMVMVLLNVIKNRVSARILFWIFTVATATLLATVTAWRPPTLTWELPLPQWMHALPAVCIGIVLGLSGRVGKAAIISWLVIATTLLVAVYAQLPGISIPYTVGIVLMGIVSSPLAIRLSKKWSVQPVSDCMLGVFLTHMLWLQIFSRMVGTGTYLTVSLTFVVALVTVFSARRMIPASRIVLG